MLRFVNTDVVFQEIPDEVTLAINISGCPCRCPGCHSRYLWDDIGEPLTSEAIEGFLGQFGKDITCLALMGGDGDPVAINDLARYIHGHHPAYRVAWYSGRIRIPSNICKADFDYIKVGPYIRHLGPLSKCTTNQRLYRVLPDGEMQDITSRFWKKPL